MAAKVHRPAGSQPLHAMLAEMWEVFDEQGLDDQINSRANPA